MYHAPVFSSEPNTAPSPHKSPRSIVLYIYAAIIPKSRLLFSDYHNFLIIYSMIK
jgi:hypothetical protein